MELTNDRGIVTWETGAMNMGRYFHKMRTILENGIHTVAQITSRFQTQTAIVLDNPMKPQISSATKLSTSTFPSRVAVEKTMEWTKISSKRTIEKIHGFVSTEEKLQYTQYRNKLKQQFIKSDVTEFAQKEPFIFDILNRALKGFTKRGEEIFLSQLLSVEKPDSKYLNHLVFVLRQTMIGSVVPTKAETKDINAILSNNKVKDSLLKFLKQENSHSRVQALQSSKFLTLQKSPILERLIEKDTTISHIALDELFTHFSLYFPIETEKNVSIILSTPKKEQTTADIIPFHAWLGKKGYKWNNLPIWEMLKEFSYRDAQSLFKLPSTDNIIPHIIKNSDGSLYSAKKLSMNDSIIELSKKKSFAHMLRNIFKTPELKKYNIQPEIRIPAAILLDIMDNTPVTSEEIEFISEILDNPTFNQLFIEAFTKLQSDNRIGEFNIIKHSHITAHTLLQFFQKLWNNDILENSREKIYAVA